MDNASSDALVITSGPMAGQTVPLERRELILGRDPSNDLALTEYTQLSRRHAKLIPTPKGWVVEDLDSTNGVIVDGTRVAKKALKHGDRLKMGDFEALVRVYSSAPTVPIQTTPLQPPPIPDSSGVTTPPYPLRKSQKWVAPALGATIVVLMGMMFVAGRGRNNVATDADTQAKTQRVVDTGSTGDTSDTGTDTSDAGNTGNVAPPVDKGELAPPVNGRIAPATVALAKNATVLVVRPEGTQVAFGSGFVSGNGHQVITNRHVVADEGQIGDCLLVFGAGTASERKVKVVASDIQLASEVGVNDSFASDLAVLNLPGDIEVPTALPLGNSEELSETDTTWVFGFPLGIGTLTLDRELPSVSVKSAGVERVQRGQVNGVEAAKVIQLGSTVTHGNSGGPVLNAKGEVVGVVSQGNEGTGISYAIPTVWVKRLVQ